MTRTAQSHTRPVAELVTASILLLVGLVYGYRAVQEGIGTPGEAGPGFFPLLVAVVLAGSSATVLAGGWSGAAERPAQADGDDSDETASTDETTSWLRIAGVLLAALAVPLLAHTTGFVVTLSVAVVAIAKIMGMPGWFKPALLGVAFGATSWFVFVYWLFVPLPAGSLGLV